MLEKKKEKGKTRFVSGEKKGERLAPTNFSRFTTKPFS